MFDVFQATDGWRWRFFARNGRILADSGEAYNQEADLDHAIGLAKTPRLLTFSVYQSGAQWYWRARASNGRIIADGAEGYHHKADCEHGANTFGSEGPSALVKKPPKPQR